jgi:hypothetical protein
LKYKDTLCVQYSSYVRVKTSFSVIAVLLPHVNNSGSVVTSLVFLNFEFPASHSLSSKQISLRCITHTLKSLNITVFFIAFDNRIGFIQFFTKIVAHSACQSFHLYSTAAFGVTQSSYASSKV